MCFPFHARSRSGNRYGLKLSKAAHMAAEDPFIADGPQPVHSSIVAKKDPTPRRRARPAHAHLIASVSALSYQTWWRTPLPLNQSKNTLVVLLSQRTGPTAVRFVRRDSIWPKDICGQAERGQPWTWSPWISQKAPRELLAQVNR